MNKFLWIAPFVFFLVGYSCMSILYQPKTVETPVLIGKTIQEAMRITAPKNLSIRLLDEKEDSELPAGTIISQNPVACCPIKANQSIIVVVSKKTVRKTPNLIGKQLDNITQDLKNTDFQCRYYEVAGTQPSGTCIAQDPSPGAIATDSVVTIYLCNGQTEPYLFPDFRNKSVQTVQNFLTGTPATIDILHTHEQPDDHTCSACIVIEQRPRAGSIITLDPKRPMHVQLRVAPVDQPQPE